MRMSKQKICEQVIEKGAYMEVAKISSKGQITIPISVRNKLKLKSGDKLVIVEENGRFYVVDRRENSTDNNICTIQQVNDAKKKHWNVLKSDSGEFTGH